MSHGILSLIMGEQLSTDVHKCPCNIAQEKPRNCWKESAGFTWQFFWSFLYEGKNSFSKSPWTLNSSFLLLQNHANFSILRAKFGLVCLCGHSTTSGLGWSFCQPLSIKTGLIPGNTCSQTPTSGPSKSFKAEQNWGTRHFVLLHGTNTGAERYSYGNSFSSYNCCWQNWLSSGTRFRYRAIWSVFSWNKVVFSSAKVVLTRDSIPPTILIPSVKWRFYIKLRREVAMADILSFSVVSNRRLMKTGSPPRYRLRRFRLNVLPTQWRFRSSFYPQPFSVSLRFLCVSLFWALRSGFSVFSWWYFPLLPHQNLPCQLEYPLPVFHSGENKWIQRGLTTNKIYNF